MSAAVNTNDDNPVVLLPAAGSDASCLALVEVPQLFVMKESGPFVPDLIVTIKGF